MEKDITAKWIVHTPSGPVPACDDHAEKILSLFSWMGVHANKQPFPEPFVMNCTNCVNETLKKKD